MEFRLIFVLAWMSQEVQSFPYDQSLSFSPAINTSVLNTPSFWHGVLPSRLFENEIKLEFYLNKPQGLLFYAIDNFYQTSWLEFDNIYILFNYYSFKMEIIDQYKYEIKILCNLQKVKNSLLKIKLSLLGNALSIECNKNKRKVFYSPNGQLVSNKTLVNFFAKMKMPVPFFDYNSTNKVNQTYLWIGNTPATNYNKYGNNKLEVQPYPLLGCIPSFSTGNVIINLATEGIREGNMVEPLCNPVCGTSPCHKGASCIERWRKRFQCDCGLSNLLGKFCNESYGVNFNGNLSFEFTLEYKLQNFQITFNHIYTYIKFQSHNIFSIQFIFNQQLNVYIDNRKALQIKFKTEKFGTIDITLLSEIINNKTYILIINVDTNEMSFKLVDFERYSTVVEHKVPLSLPNLISTNILVGDSHEVTMKWMEKFHGCISNVQLIAGARKFQWNSIKNFDKLPKCQKNASSQYKIQNKSRKMDLFNIVSLSSVNSANNVSSASTTYWILGIILLLIIITVGSICLYIYKKRRRNKDIKLIRPTYTSKLELRRDSDHPILIPFKPAYKASGTSISSYAGRSFTSMPPSLTSSFAIHEDRDF